jgi:hypothetical protein
MEKLQARFAFDPEPEECPEINLPGSPRAEVFK